MMIQAICFDLFGTLVQRTSKRDCYQELFRRLDVSSRHGAKVAMTMNLDFLQLAEYLKPRHGLALDDLMDDLLNDLDGINLYPDTLTALDNIRQRGVPLILISNLAQPYAEPAIKLIRHYFDVVMFSFEVGLLKPDPRIFQLASQRLGVSPECILMVGDSIRDDVEGALGAGMQVLHLDRENLSDGPKHNSINSLVQIPAIFC